MKGRVGAMKNVYCVMRESEKKKEKDNTKQTNAVRDRGEGDRSGWAGLWAGCLWILLDFLYVVHGHSQWLILGLLPSVVHPGDHGPSSVIHSCHAPSLHHGGTG